MKDTYQITNISAGIVTAEKIERKGAMIRSWKILIEEKSGKVTSQFVEEVDKSRDKLESKITKL